MKINDNIAIKDFKEHFEKFRWEPFKSSLVHWLDTGNPNGEFGLAIAKFVKEMQMDGAKAIDTANRIINSENNFKLESALKKIIELENEISILKEEVISAYNNGYRDSRRDSSTFE